MSPGEFNRAFLSLGSNIRPEIHLPACIRELAEFGEILRVSRVWQSAPVGDTDQADFLNAAVMLVTRLTAEEICRETIPQIEQRLNRVRDRENVNAARTIDVDLSLFNRDVLAIEHRRIPDPDIVSRAFVAVPLAELEPEYVHPVEGQTLHEIAGSFREGEAVPTLRLRDDVVLTAPM